MSVHSDTKEPSKGPFVLKQESLGQPELEGIEP